MKSKLLVVSLLTFLIVITSNAQSSASTSGIAVQGIVRDNNNTALTKETITFKFTLYYNNGANTNNIFVQSLPITTDAFGVFSHILDVDPSTNSSFSNNQVYLKIENVTDGVLISDEKLKHIPYAISANNGVPTGSIMSYIGTTAPEGWVLCDGQDLTSITGAEYLITLLDSNTAPNLGGMFLRGVGTNEFTPNTTVLKSRNDDQYLNHNHEAGSLTTDEEGDHNHNNKDHNGDYNQLLHYTGNYTVTGSDSSENEPDVARSRSMLPAGKHSHDLTGSTKHRGYGETRPVNYGVNYIIKL